MVRRPSTFVSRAVFCLLLGAFCAGCSSEPTALDLGPVEDIAGLEDIEAQDVGRPAKIVAGASPVLSSELISSLSRAGEPVEAVVRVLVDAEGRPMGIRVVEFSPEGSAAAEQYANEISEALWDWQYASGSRGGTPARAYLDLTFRYDPALNATTE